LFLEAKTSSDWAISERLVNQRRVWWVLLGLGESKEALREMWGQFLATKAMIFCLFTSVSRRRERALRLFVPAAEAEGRGGAGLDGSHIVNAAAERKTGGGQGKVGEANKYSLAKAKLNYSALLPVKLNCSTVAKAKLNNTALLVKLFSIAF
jgi:hypothetical protein